MWCAWVKNRNDVNENPTYKQNEAGFLVCNFWYMMVEDEEPFVFPTQVQQMFFMDEKQNPSWKMVVQKES
jgi:hypothetical protein